jgi:hypothetical protein
VCPRPVHTKAVTDSIAAELRADSYEDTGTKFSVEKGPSFWSCDCRLVRPDHAPMSYQTEQLSSVAVLPAWSTLSATHEGMRRLTQQLRCRYCTIQSRRGHTELRSLRTPGTPGTLGTPGLLRGATQLVASCSWKRSRVRIPLLRMFCNRVTRTDWLLFCLACTPQMHCLLSVLGVRPVATG